MTNPQFVRLFGGVAVACGAMLLSGCSAATTPNQWAEDGPAASEALESPSAHDLYASVQPAQQRVRDWNVTATMAQSGAVLHGPLYMENPFVDKGTSDGQYRLGWEDYVALAYSYPRYTLNWLALPVSMVVTPPWAILESDGELSRQALGYDHDAIPVSQKTPTAPPAVEQDDEATDAPVDAEAEEGTQP